MSPLRAFAPGKFNLCLFLGGTRADGLHELISVIEPLTLGDELELAPAPPGAERDEVLCPGVEGPNLAAAALAAWRGTSGWDAPPQRLTITKAVPVAAGMGGGSSDAAAALRLAAHAAGRPGDPSLHRLAAGLGADVPGLLAPVRVLASGAGERLAPLPPPRDYAVLVLPSAGALSTADVYREADRLGLARPAAELEALRAEVEHALADGGLPPAHLLVNDLQPAALSLRPEIGEALAAARAAGADHALVSGSGPTVIGLFAGGDPHTRAADAAERLRGLAPAPCTAAPAGPEAGLVTETAASARGR